MRLLTVWSILLVVVGCGNSSKNSGSSTASADKWTFKPVHGSVVAETDTVEARIALAEEGSISYKFSGDFDCHLSGDGGVRTYSCKLKKGFRPGDQTLEVTLLNKTIGTVVQGKVVYTTN